ncbi:MAG: helix-turn-helix domain-containing protein [Bacillota bacterium]|nr:helix-turn-helix domain-containing protein [Bacillota bacterium]
MISNYLKEYFKERKITHEEIERKTGIARSKITLSFNNKRNLTAEELIMIAIKFNLDLNKIKKLDNN